MYLRSEVKILLATGFLLMNSSAFSEDRRWQSFFNGEYTATQIKSGLREKPGGQVGSVNIEKDESGNLSITLHGLTFDNGTELPKFIETDLKRGGVEFLSAVVKQSRTYYGYDREGKSYPWKTSSESRHKVQIELNGDNLVMAIERAVPMYYKDKNVHIRVVNGKTYGNHRATYFDRRKIYFVLERK